MKRNTNRLLSYLQTALEESDYEGEAKRIDGLFGSAELIIIDALSVMETRVTNAAVHRAIALCKQTITGKRSDEDFLLQCRRLQGMI